VKPAGRKTAAGSEIREHIKQGPGKAHIPYPVRLAGRKTVTGRKRKDITERKKS
jgi:hypothetical protein